MILLGLIFGKINFPYFKSFRFSKTIARSLLNIGVPLVPIFIIYWANNSVIRVLIIKNLGATELGVFAIGSKYAGISSFIQAAFAGGWSFFTFSTMKDKDQTEMKSKIFESLLMIIVVVYTLLTPFVPYFFNILFSGEYVRGYTVFGQLFLGPLLLILYQIIANQFTIIEKSFYSFIALMIGFLIGVVSCYTLIFEGFGIVGASFSIPISYIIAIFLVHYFGKKYHLFVFSRYVYISFCFLIIVNVGIQVMKGFYAFLFSFFIIIAFVFINKDPLMNLSKLIKPYIKRKQIG